MFRSPSPWELDAHVRYNHALLIELGSERRRRSQIDRTDTGWWSRLSQLRRRVGFGLIQLGTTMAGDALRGLPAPARSDLANR